jgi:hypothetical protein
MCLVVSLPESCRDGEKVRALLDELMLLFRLHRPGNVYYSFIIIDDCDWYDVPDHEKYQRLQAQSLHHYIGWAHPGTEYLYVDDCAGAPLAFCCAHRGNTILRTRPYQSFSRGYHEPLSEDRFLRNVIGLENIFVNEVSEQSNVTYKFVDRGCFLLQRAAPHEGGAVAWAEVLKKLYRERGNILRGAVNT